jgi:hypothetical protein
LQASGILSAESLPLRDVQPLATIFATEMTNLNVFGQTQLMIAQLKKKKGHYATLGIIAKQGCQRLDECISALKEEKRGLIIQQEAWEEWDKEMKRKEEIAATERKEIAERKKNQAVAKLASQASGTNPKKETPEVSTQHSLFRSSIGNQYRTPSVQPQHGRSQSADTPVPQSRKRSRHSSGYEMLRDSSEEENTDEGEYGEIGNVKEDKDEENPIENDGLPKSE